ncbi:MAG: CoA transferase [Chloroflexi bacterium]|nr:CoA transferase [Chloroflexota bacterium]
MDAALSDVVILDLSINIAGSHTCMLLGEMGARVIKVELAGQPDWRGSLPYHLWNRGKRSICLDLDREGGRQAIEALVGAADVLVEDSLASEVEGWGLDYKTLSPLNQRLLYCAIPPFGDEGPLRDKPANDGVVAAFSALMGDQNGPDRPPEYIKVPGPSCGAAFLAAFAICSALYVREIDGIGQKIEVPLLNGSIAMQGSGFITGPRVINVEGTDKDPRGVKPAYRLYQCSDDKWIFIACGNETFWNRLCLSLGMEDFTTSPRFEGAPWYFDPEGQELVKSTINDKIKQHPQKHWLDFFDEQDIPVAPADTREEFIHDPQVVSDNMMIQVEDTTFGMTSQMGFALTLDGMPGAVPTPAPGRGEHGMDILKGLGYTETQCARLKRSGALIC